MKPIRFTLRVMAWALGALAVLALVFVYRAEHPGSLAMLGAAAAAGLPLLGTVAAAPMKEEEFQATVLKGIDTQRTKTDQLVADFDRLTGETKKAFDELTALKKHANDSQAGMTQFQRQIERIDALLRREARMAFGDPIRRIQEDEGMRNAFNVAIRLAVNKGDDMRRLVRGGFPKEIVARALGEDSSPGSTLIDDKLSAEVYDTLASYGIWNTFRVQRLGTKQTKFPVKTARAAAAFVLSEGGTIGDDSTKAGTSVTCEVEVIAALLKVSMQLLEDAEVDITSDVLSDFGESIAYKMDWACTQADGGSDSTDGGMTGIFGGGGTAAGAASGNTTVETLDFEDFTKCLLTVDAGVLTRPCRWWMHPQILVRALSVKDSNGRPIFLTANEAPTPGGIGSILGYPVTLGHACPSANTTSSKVAVFGDPSGQVVGVRKDFTFEASDEFSWNTYERTFRGIARAGTKIRKATAFAVLTLAAS